MDRECCNINYVLEKFNNRPQGKGIVTKEQFIQTLAKDKYNLAKDLNLGALAVVKLIKLLLPSKPRDNTKPCNYLLNKYGMKYCTKCKTVHKLENFNDNSSNKYGKNTYCKSCQNKTSGTTQSYRTAKYRTSKQQRTPKWAELELIKQFYINCPKDKVVDHIIPLQGKTVCGLHVINNLQYLTNSENCRKNNKF